MDFLNKLDKAIDKNNSLVCVGLDPDEEKIATLSGVSLKGTLFDFNKWIIDQTADLVCCYKPQYAFYAAAGIKGIEDLKKTIDYIHSTYQNIPVILDGKRGDVGHTSEMYVKEVFDVFNADAVTVNPYCGFDAVKPFAKRAEKGIFVICKTSNPSAADFMDQQVGDEKLYEKVAKKIVQWNKQYSNVLLEIGATWPGEIKTVRNLAPDMLFLIAGIGAQGGDLEGTLKNGLRSDKKGLIISSSRGIIYDQDPEAAAKKLRDDINKFR